MDSLNNSFEKYFNLNLQKPLGKLGEIQHKELTIKYLLTKDASEENVLDLLIFDSYGFPPVHKRINNQGGIRDLENFQFSIMCESQREKNQEELKMKEFNQRTAKLIINKGLANMNDDWIKEIPVNSGMGYGIPQQRK